MPMFRDKSQKMGVYGFIGGLMIALAIWGAFVDGWPGTAMQALAAVVITLLLLDANGMLGSRD